MGCALFRGQVARKTSTDMLDHVEAEREVFVDWLTAQEGGNNKALLYVLKKSNSTEPKVRRWQVTTERRSCSYGVSQNRWNPLT